MINHIFALSLPLFLFVSCGQSPSGAGIQKPDSGLSPVRIDIDAKIDGEYLAVFETVNSSLTGKITGAFTFARDKFEDELIGDVRLNNGGAELIHAQNVRLGTRCPTEADDLNLDGVIDPREGEAVYGRIFFPLDGDLSSQSSHDGEFPIGNAYGNYIYSRATKFSKFMKDLRSVDEGEGYFKLKKTEPLMIEGLVVVIHGVDAASDLPVTARSLNRTSIHQAMPIACGIIRKVDVVPGEIEEF